MALLNAGCRRKVEAIVRTISKMETATEPKFQQHFVDAMAFPNKVDPFTHLRERVELPQPESKSAGTSVRRRAPRRC
jgi:uncharacterized 2Fe-2S/4Fe-4S cluster protein (DUF4445 family)